jgi:hypothetical protein
MEKKKLHKRGGPRPNSGRPEKDKTLWGQITCVLRKDTIQRLKEGCGGKMKHFGQFLQDHLDRHPLPDRQTYMEWKAIRLLNGKPNPERERLVRQMKREKKRQERLTKMWTESTPKERNMIRTLQKLQKEDEKKLAAK